MKRDEFIDLVLLASEKAVTKKLVFSRPRVREEKKVTARLVSHKGRHILAFEYSLPGDTVRHENIPLSTVRERLSELSGEYSQANLITSLGDVELKTSQKGKTALLGGDKLRNKLSGGDFVSAVEALDKTKNYILSGNEDFLIALGVSDRSGRVHDKKQGKFRQINRFLEHIGDIYAELPGEGELYILDLCCGKSYLSFAVYYYLTAIKSREVKLVGIDLKRDVIEWCKTLAEKLSYTGMEFICDDVKNSPRDRADMVISLHACDIATDIVIDRAIEVRAKVILSTPCCHRYLNDKISQEALRFVTRFPHLRNKLCEAITDSIRLARLEANGYKVAALELTDPDDTPKNTLIRAVYTGNTQGRYEYDKILDYILGDKKDDYLKECK